MKIFNQNDDPHRRYNPLTGEWVLVSPHRAKRPWQGQKELVANGVRNKQYNNVFSFENDFPALLDEKVSHEKSNESKLLLLRPELGINKVICFSPKHNLTLPEMSVEAIEKVIAQWQNHYQELGGMDFINYVQIFENKGSVMGCSNPHPHGQIWAQSSLPTQVENTQRHLLAYHQLHRRSLLKDYIDEELKRQERIVIENEYFIVVVPFWAIWPYETMVVSRRHFTHINEMSNAERYSFAEVLKEITIKYDNIFETSFPYSAGIHQAPTDSLDHSEWHFHMHFYPPLLRSATVKKFMVGYEMLGEAQRDIVPEKSAEILRSLSNIHYKVR